mmetsp:Transcript_7593/g.26102  ORF Transcript_7593/g.26102 Transcript_7593/m.26102 type:complete len:296 (+) Transcript_7593:392-1279(+)
MASSVISTSPSPSSSLLFARGVASTAACCLGWGSVSGLESPADACSPEPSPSPPWPPLPCSSSFRSRSLAASCLALSSSMETRSASASSGSRLGSTPNSKSLPPPAPPPLPPAPAPLPPSSLSPMNTGVESNMSLRMVPGGTVTKCDWSLELAALRKLSSFSAFCWAASSPKDTMSIETLFFFSFLATLTRAFSSSARGEPMKATMRCLWFLFCRCFRASWAIWTPWTSETLPSGLISRMQWRTRPKSGVGVARTLGPLTPARERTPTVFSGFEPVFAPASRFTASAWACSLVGL